MALYDLRLVAKRNVSPLQIESQQDKQQGGAISGDFLGGLDDWGGACVGALGRVVQGGGGRLGTLAGVPGMKVRLFTWWDL